MKQKFDIDFDVRVVERNIRDSKITSKDYQKHLENLDDLTDDAEPLVIEDDSDEQQSEEQMSDDIEVSDNTEVVVDNEKGED
jgi:hypothetical protein